MSRPRITQPFIPVVQFFINGKDILLSDDEKPRSLISFTYSVTFDGAGQFRLEVFDPDYEEIEAILLTNSTHGTPAGTNTDVMYPVNFRFGYVGPDGNPVLSSNQQGKGFYTGFVTMYVPTMKTNGVTLVIEGLTTGFSPRSFKRKMRTDTSSFYKEPINKLIEKVCVDQTWELVCNDGLPELTPQKQFEILEDATSGVDSTEIEPKSMKVAEDETPFSFVSRVIKYARPVGNKYGVYHARLEYATDVDANGHPIGDPKGYLYIEVKDSRKGAVRSYSYMRNYESDVISYAPVVQPFAGTAMGSEGFISNSENPAQGMLDSHIYDEANKYVKTFSTHRQETAVRNPSQGEVQEAVYIESEEDSAKLEGTVHGQNTLVEPTQISPDEPVKELVLRENNSFVVDRLATNYWLLLNQFVRNASLEIVGDPSPDLQPGNVIDVWVFRPIDEQRFKPHYTSQRWFINGVVHNIAGGVYTTSLELGVHGWIKGGKATQGPSTPGPEEPDDPPPPPFLS